MNKKVNYNTQSKQNKLKNYNRIFNSVKDKTNFVIIIKH